MSILSRGKFRHTRGTRDSLGQKAWSEQKETTEYIHKNGVRVKMKWERSYVTGIDEETLRELQRQSNLNLIRVNDADISQMSTRQRRMLKQAGIIRRRIGTSRGGSRLEFTERGKILLEEIRNE